MYGSYCSKGILDCKSLVGQMYCMRSCGKCAHIDQMFVCKDERPEFCGMINCANPLGSSLKWYLGFSSLGVLVWDSRTTNRLRIRNPDDTKPRKFKVKIRWIPVIAELKKRPSDLVTAPVILREFPNNLCNPFEHDLRCASLCGVDFVFKRERREKRVQRLKEGKRGRNFWTRIYEFWSCDNSKFRFENFGIQFPVISGQWISLIISSRWTDYLKLKKPTCIAQKHAIVVWNRVIWEDNKWDRPQQKGQQQREEQQHQNQQNFHNGLIVTWKRKKKKNWKHLKK